MKKRNADIPEDESAFDKIDSDNWIYMQADLDSLHTQKDSLHMYHQIMGIERYLTSLPNDANLKSLLKQLEIGKKAIAEKRIEFFEKEEGHIYEKIVEGVYQRK